MPTGTASWEDLRKKARYVENDIDNKLVSLNKLGASLGGRSSRFDANFASGASYEKSPLVATQSTFDSLCLELEQAVARLTELNEQMSQLVDGGMEEAAQNTALQHTLRRHRDILRDYSSEFARSRANVKAQLEREALLGAGRDETNSLNRRSDTYLKEHDHARSSDRLLDEQISIAMATKENLMSQRGFLHDVTKKINTITKRYPALNSLMQKIHVKKRKDTLVLAAVITVCLILLFLYAMH